jgi:toxin FitB
VIIVDTNVVSELMRPAPSEVVLAWLSRHRSEDMATTSITVAEILYGIDHLPEGRRKQVFRTTATEVFRSFVDRVMAFDIDAADRYASVVSRRERSGRPIDGFDAQIASICLAGDAPLATRNVKDFADTGVDVIDPWGGATAP